MNFAPGQNIFICKKERKNGSSAVVISTGEGSCLVIGGQLPDVMLREILRGEIVKVGVPQQGDALYIYSAVVADVLVKESIILLLLNNFSPPVRQQRREWERTSTVIKVSYLPFSDKGIASSRGRGRVKEGLIIELSEGGLLLAARNPLPLGTELYCSYEVTVDEEKQLLGAVGRAVRRHFPLEGKVHPPWNYYFGVKFKTAPRPSRLTFSC